jgi:hypothetical protein
MVHLISKYLLESAIVGGCFVVFVLRTIKTAKDRRDCNRIYQFLCRSVKDEQYQFRSSETISAVTNLPVSRVADLCSKHGHIERKEAQRHMWRVNGSAESYDPYDPRLRRIRQLGRNARQSEGILNRYLARSPFFLLKRREH